MKRKQPFCGMQSGCFLRLAVNCFWTDKRLSGSLTIIKAWTTYSESHWKAGPWMQGKDVCCWEKAAETFPAGSYCLSCNLFGGQCRKEYGPGLFLKRYRVWGKLLNWEWSGRFQCRIGICRWSPHARRLRTVLVSAPFVALQDFFRFAVSPVSCVITSAIKSIGAVSECKQMKSWKTTWQRKKYSL